MSARYLIQDFFFELTFFPKSQMELLVAHGPLQSIKSQNINLFRKL